MKRILHRHNVIFWLLLCIIGCRIAWANDLIVDRGNAAGSVVVGRDSGGEIVIDAARDLAGYLRRMSGAEIPVIEEGKASPSGFLIHIGATADAPVDPSLLVNENIGLDGFVIQSIPNGVTIVGRTPQGTANGVYHFAEEVLGVHWYSVEDDEPTVPLRQTVEIPKLNLTVKPDAILRAQFYSFQQTQKPYVDGKSRLAKKLAANAERWWRFNRAISFPAEAAHSFSSIVPAGLFDAHPEYFPYIDYTFAPNSRNKRIGPKSDGSLPAWPFKVGRQRGDASVQRCLSNPHVQRLAAEYTARQFDADPTLLFASLSANDGPWWCDCDACKKTGRTLSERNLAFCNAVAKLNEQKYPDRGYIFYAYWDTVEPPTTMKAHRNVVPMIATLWQCRVHPFSSSCQDSVFHRNVVDGWYKAAGRVAWRPYTAAGPFTFPTVASEAEELRYYRDHGSIGGMREYQFPPRVNFALLAWAETKLLWNADLDPAKLRRQFIEGYYGVPAADAMEQIYEFVEQQVPAQKRSWGLEDGTGIHGADVNELFGPVMAQCSERFEAALQASRDEPEVFRHRVQRDIATLRGQSGTEYTE